MQLHSFQLSQLQNSNEVDTNVSQERFRSRSEVSHVDGRRFGGFAIDSELKMRSTENAFFLFS